MQIQIESKPRPEDCQAIRDGLAEYNKLYADPDHFEPLSIFVRDDQRAICGGLLGETFWGWLHISILWLAEEKRGQSLGSQLLQLAEEEAVRRGCRGVFVDTLSFQAPDFYLQHGYSIWGQLENLPPGHQRIFLQKQLSVNA